MTVVNMGGLINGDNGGTSSDHLAPPQIDDYSGYLIAGTTYYLYVGDISTEPLNLNLANIYGLVDSGVSQPGQNSTYTPTVSGEYVLAVEGYVGNAATFTLTGGVNKDMGTFVGGEVFSDALSPWQQDGYSADLLARTTYYLNLTSASEPISVSIAGPAGSNNITNILQHGHEDQLHPEREWTILAGD